MLHTSSCFFKAAFILALAACIVACQDNPPDTTISQFDRPQDVAFVCYERAKSQTLPLECCRTKGVTNGKICQGFIPTASLYAFVTQTTPGEVAVVDITGQRIVDQEASIPYNSFIPVGGQPSDIAATQDGSKVYTANYETGDLSVIEVIDESNDYSVFTNPSLKPARSINLEAPAARFVLSRHDDRDRFAFVTQPTENRLAVVALRSEDCPDKTQDAGAPEANSDGCLLGWLNLNSVMGIDIPDSDAGMDQNSDGGPETYSDGIRPWAIVASDATQHIYVSATNSEFIIEVDSIILAQEALSLDEKGPLGDSSVVRRFDIEGYTTRALALEPTPERWLYAIEQEEGGIIAINLIQGEMIPVDGNDFSIEVPGRARALTLLKLAENEGLAENEEDPGPLNFNGTFAVVSTTKAGIYVIDVDDMAPHAQYPHTHSLRSGVNLDPEADAGVMPSLVDKPVLNLYGDVVPEKQALDYAYIEDPEADNLDAGPDLDAGGLDAGDQDAGEPPECRPPDDGYEFGPQWDYGFQYRCDPNQWSREDWRLTWQGSLGITGAAAIEYAHLESDADAGLMVVTDEVKGFCERGLMARDDANGYPGDLFVITSKPTNYPEFNKDCAKFHDEEELVYVVDKVIDPNPGGDVSDVNSIRIGTIGGDYNYSVPNLLCYGQAVSYEIRAQDHWVLAGSNSGHLYDGEFDNDTRTCVPGPKEAEGRRHRVYPGELFENYYFRFTLQHGQYFPDGGVEESEEDSTEDTYIEFTTQGGFEILAAYIGSNVTDIVATPDLDLVLVDQDDEGLVLFDMTNEFTVLGHSVN
ncbi:MAG: hypothetical protein GY854_32290 [Deltaproteobacteria bacterium]|nr:hypothetical protein [Deltaproteobacteria bacterium]